MKPYRTISQSYERTFDPHAYLRLYYSGQDINEDERRTYQEIVTYLQAHQPAFPRMLEVGCGPTIHNVIPFVPYVDEIHMADYMHTNLTHIQTWLDDDQSAHNWDVYIQACLALESPHRQRVEDRARQMRQKITKLRIVDLGSTLPLGEATTYPLVISFYCADSASNSKDMWRAFMHNLCSIVQTRGTLILSAFCNTSQYRVGTTRFPNARINEHDMRTVLHEEGFHNQMTHVQTHQFHGWEKEGLHHFLLATAVKTA